ncbi:MAG: GAF domain-containing protein [Catalinimonas sp.]
MKNLRLSVGTKIVAGFTVLIVSFSLFGGWNIWQLNKNAQVVARNGEVISPSLAALNELELMIVRSKMLVTNWVYLQMNEDDKKELRQLHQTEYPTLKARLGRLSEAWNDKAQAAGLDSLLDDYEILLAEQQKVMQALVSFDDYADPVKKTFEGEARIEDEVLPRTAALLGRLDGLIDVKRAQQEVAKAEVLESFELLNQVILITSLTLGVLFLAIALLTARSIVRPINRLREVIRRLSRGELIETSDHTYRQDEIGDMGRAVNQLSDGLRQTLTFAEDIGKGNLDADYRPMSEDDVLGQALLEMRANLKQVADDETRRNWTTEGMAKFGEVLRQNTNDLGELADEIIAGLVKYTDSNQGRLFIVDGQEGEDDYLSLQGCYAWDRKKHLHQRIELGEGLAGQAWQENTTIYLTDVPEGYVSIRSGLGDASPTCVLIVPMKVNDATYGVIELASFKVLEPHVVQFVERIATSIGSTVSSVRVNQRTTVLLEESQMLTEQMRAQEEEMRQNMEELQATQEEMQRSQSEAREKERLFDGNYGMMETDTTGMIHACNARMADLLGYTSADVRNQPLSRFLAAADAALQHLGRSEQWSGTTALRHGNGHQEPHYVAAARLDQRSGHGGRYLFTVTPAVAPAEIGK